MTDKELLERIKKSAEQTAVPDSLTPKNITKKLKKPAQRQKPHRFPPLKTASAAAVVLLCGALFGTALQTKQTSTKHSANETAPVNETIAAESGKTEKEIQAEKRDEPKQDAGTLYTVAKSYRQICDALESASLFYPETAETSLEDSADGGFAAEEKQASTGIAESLSSRSAKKESHSSTNLQTEGVDESDRIKTDGRYIYTATDEKVFITDAAEGDLRPVPPIAPDLDSAGSILEIYVDNDALLIVTERCDTKLENETYYKEVQPDSTDTTSGFVPLENGAEDFAAKKAYIQTNPSVMLFIYDISDPASPTLSGSVSQDGFYQSSRKIGDIVYLFTKKGQFADASSYAEDSGGVIPCINGEKIPTDHIYLPQNGNGNDGLILSSVNIKKPDEILDQVMIIHSYVTIYVGTDSIYFYHNDYQNNATVTQIAKFSIENGTIQAVNAASVKGSVLDAFAVNESENTLRVLTTSYDSGEDTENCLYIFDKDLKQTGLLSGIARGEEIYAARFLKDTAYFITYRNTDPLFAADLSDPSNPVLIGELKITGFSEYLHFWGEDKLLGFGYETDPDTGSSEGLKLVMFDISNPADLKTAGACVLDQYCYSPALYDYKTILADPRQNLIGFAADLRADEAEGITDYCVYSWENGQFIKKMLQKLPRETVSDSVRGLYIGDRFYIADSAQIIGYDMEDGFRQISQRTLE